MGVCLSLALGSFYILICLLPSVQVVWMAQAVAAYKMKFKKVCSHATVTLSCLMALYLHNQERYWTIPNDRVDKSWDCLLP